MRKIITFVVALTIAFLPGFINRFTSKTEGNIWYNSLKSSSLTPPDMFFPIIWSILYCLIGISLYRILIKKNRNSTFGLMFLFINLGLNSLWTFIFFTLHEVVFAILILLALIYTAQRAKQEFSKIDELSGQLLIPYIIWLWFALFLSASFLFLNWNAL